MAELIQALKHLTLDWTIIIFQNRLLTNQRHFPKSLPMPQSFFKVPRTSLWYSSSGVKAWQSGTTSFQLQWELYPTMWSFENCSSSLASHNPPHTLCDLQHTLGSTSPSLFLVTEPFTENQRFPHILVRRDLLSFLPVVIEHALPLQIFQTQRHGLTARQLDLTWLLTSILGQSYLGKARIYVYTVAKRGKPQSYSLGTTAHTHKSWSWDWIYLIPSTVDNHRLDWARNKGSIF